MKTFHSTIIFTKTPLNKYFRFLDVFQILPCHHLKDLPYSDLQRHYPAILEYWTSYEEEVAVPEIFEGLKDFVTSTTRMIVKQDLILSLLSCFTNHLFFRYSDTTGTWGVPMLDDNASREEMDTWSSKWNLVLFHSPGLSKQLKITGFSKHQYNDIELSKHFPYYQDDPNLDTDKNREITFPETIYMDLDSYFSQDKESKDVLNTAISYAVSAIELKQIKKTMSVVAAFTAVETMVNFEFRNQEAEKCNTCGQLQFKVAKKYRDYLLKYLGDSAHNKKKFNAYYSLRSKIVHTGQRFETESLFADVPEEKKNKEYLDQLEILILSKFAVVQWLLRNYKRTDKEVVEA